MKLIISTAAEADLNEIFDYSLDHWGIEQAIAYVRSFDHPLGCIADDGMLGKPVRLGAIEFRAFKHRQHVIFYQLEEGAVIVSRVLHVRMDFIRHLT